MLSLEKFENKTKGCAARGVAPGSQLEGEGSLGFTSSRLRFSVISLVKQGLNVISALESFSRIQGVAFRGMPDNGVSARMM